MEFETMFRGFGQSTWLPFPVIAARLLLATALGAAVGIEREWRSQHAGLRTHMLVAVATAAIAILTIEISRADLFDQQEIRMDPLRLIEATTAGIAFLAAGMIIFARGKVRGLTTGAGMWLTGAIGMCVGLGYWQIGLLTTLIAVTVMGLLHWVEPRRAVDREPPANKTRPD